MTEGDAFNGATGMKFIRLGQNVMEIKRRTFANAGTICVIMESPDISFNSSIFTNANVIIICRDDT